jgi:hypothetical protein
LWRWKHSIIRRQKIFSRHRNTRKLNFKNKKYLFRILAYEVQTLHAAKSAAKRTRAGEAESPLFNAAMGGPLPAKWARTVAARGRGEPQPGPSAPAAGTGNLHSRTAHHN